MDDEAGSCWGWEEGEEDGEKRMEYHWQLIAIINQSLNYKLNIDW